MLQGALGTAFIIDNRQFSELHLVKERQHQASIQGANQQVLWTPDIGCSFECGRVADFHGRMLCRGQCFSKSGLPADTVLEVEKCGTASSVPLMYTCSVSVAGTEQSSQAPSSPPHDACFCYEYE